MRHVEQCRACREQAADYARLHEALSAGLYRSTCPSTLTIGEFALGVLTPEEQQAVAEHIVDCRQCAAERREFVAFLNDDAEPEPARRFVDTVRRLLARPLAFPTPALAGLRGDADPDGGVYVAEGFRVTISVQRATRGARGSVLVGLVEPWTMAGDGGRARLYAGDRVVQTQEVDDLGNFVFDAVPAGSYRIEVKLSDVLVTIDTITVS
jgi:hypothetical protein